MSKLIEKLDKYIDAAHTRKIKRDITSYERRQFFIAARDIIEDTSEADINQRCATMGGDSTSKVQFLKDINLEYRERIAELIEMDDTFAGSFEEYKGAFNKAAEIDSVPEEADLFTRAKVIGTRLCHLGTFMTLNNAEDDLYGKFSFR